MTGTWHISPLTTLFSSFLLLLSLSKNSLSSLLKKHTFCQILKTTQLNTWNDIQIAGRTCVYLPKYPSRPPQHHRSSGGAPPLGPTSDHQILLNRTNPISCPFNHYALNFLTPLFLLFLSLSKFTFSLYHNLSLLIFSSTQWGQFLILWSTLPTAQQRPSNLRFGFLSFKKGIKKTFF